MTLHAREWWQPRRTEIRPGLVVSTARSPGGPRPYEVAALTPDDLHHVTRHETAEDAREAHDALARALAEVTP